MVLRKEEAEKIAFATNGKHERIIKSLNLLGHNAKDETAESGYMNIKVFNEDGTVIRFYKPNGRKCKVQVWVPVQFKYSGIPTFEPSGRRSI